MCVCLCECCGSDEGKGGTQWESDLNKILLLSSVGPPGVLSGGYDDRGRLRAQALH